jgi:hypothetical protein
MREELLERLEGEVLSWPGVVKEDGGDGTTVYRLRRRETGHLHEDDVADVPFTRALRDELIAGGRADPHRAGISGYVSYRVDAAERVEGALALLRLSYPRARSAAERRDARWLAARPSRH